MVAGHETLCVSFQLEFSGVTSVIVGRTTFISPLTSGAHGDFAATGASTFACTCEDCLHPAMMITAKNKKKD